MAAVNIPSLEDAKSALDRTGEELKYWAEYYRSLLEQYPEQFVAVVDGRVVAHNSSLEKLLEALREQGRERTSAWVRFISAHPQYPIR